MAQWVENLACNAGDKDSTLGREDLEEEMTNSTQYSYLKIQWTESLEGNNPKCHKKLSTTERLSTWCLTETERHELCLLMKLENMWV